ncbi:MAG: DNA primase [Acetobacterales bacterium]
MAFPASFIEELKNRLSLPEVVGRRVRLQRKGREYAGLCPFHNEKTPSFNVVPDKGFYHCFGCGAHGSVFDFVMETENLSFVEAVERLAQDVGMTVPRADPREREREQRRAGTIGTLEAACAWFQKMLQAPEGEAARAYLRNRGLDDGTVAAFRLGYAPGGGALKAALAREGIGDEQLFEAGLLKPSDDGREPYEYFRGRVTFPITDSRGRVIAFGGRTLGDGQPKYLNSPETALFHKGRVLYGLAQARAAADRGDLIVAEGYMDVIALHRAGFPRAVAPLGTALTEEQIRLLWTLSNEPVLCLDGDTAGRRAALRAAERTLPLLAPGYSLRFALLQPGDDPDSLIVRAGPDAIRNVLSGARPLADLIWEAAVEAVPSETPEQRAALAEHLKQRAGEVADPTVRPHFEARLDQLYAERFGLYLSGRRARRPRGGRQFGDRKFGDRQSGDRQFGDRQFGDRLAAPVRVAPPLDSKAVQEAILLAVAINHPGLFDRIGEELGALFFVGEERERLRRAVVTALSDERLEREVLRRHLSEAGLQRQADAVLSRATYVHAGFARPEAEEAEVLVGWDDILSQMRERSLDVELEQAVRAFENDPSPENQRRLQALSRLKGRRRELAYPGEDPGIGPGAV